MWLLSSVLQTACIFFIIRKDIDSKVKGIRKTNNLSFMPSCAYFREMCSDKKKVKWKNFNPAGPGLHLGFLQKLLKEVTWNSERVLLIVPWSWSHAMYYSNNMATVLSATTLDFALLYITHIHSFICPSVAWICNRKEAQALWWKTYGIKYMLQKQVLKVWLLWETLIVLFF